MKPIEEMIMSRGTYAPPVLILSQIFKNEGIELCEGIAVIQIIKMLQEHKHLNLSKYIYFDSDMELTFTSFGFWACKPVLLKYLSRDTYHDYLDRIHKCDRLIRGRNDLLDYIRSLSTNQISVVVIRAGVNDFTSEEKYGFFIRCMIAELKSRRYGR